MKTRKPSRVWGVAGLALAGSMLLGACDSMPELNDIAPTAQSHLEDATSVRLELDDVEFDDGVISGVVEGQLDDSNYHISQEVTDDDVTYAWEKLQVSEDDAFFKGDAAAFEANDKPVLAESADGKWVSTRDQVGISAIYSQILDGLAGGDLSGLQDVDSEKTELDGEDVYHYSGTDASGRLIEVYYTTDKRLRRVEFRETEDDQAQTVDFTDWNEVEEFEAPDASEILESDAATPAKDSEKDSKKDKDEKSKKDDDK